MPTHTPDRMPEDLTDRLPEDVSDRLPKKVCQKIDYLFEGTTNSKHKIEKNIGNSYAFLFHNIYSSTLKAIFARFLLTSNFISKSLKNTQKSRKTQTHIASHSQNKILL